MEKIYGNYLDTIKGVLSSKQTIGNTQKFNLDGLEKADAGRTFSKSRIELNEDIEPSQALQAIAKITGVQKFGNSKLGIHPDFAHLIGTTNAEYHYITSAFIDVKNSTNLYKKYSHEQIYIVLNTILKAAIHTCTAFGGHVQRIQGDGIFVYFGGKSVTKSDSVKHAVTATAMFTYFVKNDLQNLFELEGIEDIYTRVGIDFGDDRDVLWTVFGSDYCNELTTLSLHTSLAYKLQTAAKSNGIVVGDNVKNYLSDVSELFKAPVKSDGAFDATLKYVYRDVANNYFYAQYDLDWFRYLKTIPYIKVNENGNLFIHTEGYKNEETRRNNLQLDANIVSSGKVGLDRQKQVSSSDNSVKFPDNRFYSKDDRF